MAGSMELLAALLGAVATRGEDEVVQVLRQLGVPARPGEGHDYSKSSNGRGSNGSSPRTPRLARSRERVAGGGGSGDRAGNGSRSGGGGGAGSGSGSGGGWAGSVEVSPSLSDESQDVDEDAIRSNRGTPLSYMQRRGDEGSDQHQVGAAFFFPASRNCPCCSGYKHGCACCVGQVNACTHASCAGVDSSDGEGEEELAAAPAGADASLARTSPDGETRPLIIRRPTVPSATALYEAMPNIVYDLFTVHPVQLVRRAMDAMTKALHFYVLRTMIGTTRFGGAILGYYFQPAAPGFVAGGGAGGGPGAMMGAGRGGGGRGIAGGRGMGMGPGAAAAAAAAAAVGGRGGGGGAAAGQSMWINLPDIPRVGDVTPIMRANAVRAFWSAVHSFNSREDWIESPYTSPMDLRPLLRNIRRNCTGGTWKPFGFDLKRFFPPEITALFVDELVDLINFFYHRNYLVMHPGEELDDNAFGQGWSRRELGATRGMISRLLTLATTLSGMCVQLVTPADQLTFYGAAQAPEPEAIDAMNQCAAAARVYFENVESLSRVYEKLYGPDQLQRISTNPDSELAQASQKLVKISEEMRHFSSDSINLSSVRLWEYFGLGRGNLHHLGTSDHAGTADKDQSELLHHAIHSIRRIISFSVAPPPNVLPGGALRFIVPTPVPVVNGEPRGQNPYYIDPTAITNLDLVWIALDLTGRAVRRVLRDCMLYLGENEMHDGHFSASFSLGHAVPVIHLYRSLQNFQYLKHQSRTLHDGITVYEELPNAGFANLFTEWRAVPGNGQQVGETSYQYLARFVSQSSHFSDPRFVARFVHWSCSGLENYATGRPIHTDLTRTDFMMRLTALMTSAEAVQQIRDPAAHRRHEVRYQSVGTQIQQLQTFVESMIVFIPPAHTNSRGRLPNIAGMVESRALEELRALDPSEHRRYRGRQIDVIRVLPRREAAAAAAAAAWGQTAPAVPAAISAIENISTPKHAHRAAFDTVNWLQRWLAQEDKRVPPQQLVPGANVDVLLDGLRRIMLMYDA